MMMTAELEPVPRSIILATLTNPAFGRSLLDGLKERNQKNHAWRLQPQVRRHRQAPAKAGAKPTSSGQARGKTGRRQACRGREDGFENNLTIEGSHSDIEVACFIANLSFLHSADNALIESKEQKIDNIVYRQFRLQTSLKSN
jgi:hypothetical protein